MITIVFAMVMYLLNMFLILVCKVPDMLAPARCSLCIRDWDLRLQAAAPYPQA